MSASSRGKCRKSLRVASSSAAGAARARRHIIVLVPEYVSGTLYAWHVGQSIQRERIVGLCGAGLLKDGVIALIESA